MELSNPVYPMRAIARCKAKSHLLRIASEYPEQLLPPDEALFNSIAATLFQSDCSARLYQACRSKQEAAAIEDSIAIAVAETYAQIRLQQADPLVQQLNALL